MPTYGRWDGICPLFLTDAEVGQKNYTENSQQATRTHLSPRKHTRSYC